MNEIRFGYPTGRTLTYTVRTAAGAVVTGPTALPESSAGYYTASEALVVAGHFIIVTDSVLGVVGQGDYEPLTSTLATTAHVQEVEDKVDTLDTNVDTLLVQMPRAIVIEDRTGEVQPSQRIEVT